MSPPEPPEAEALDHEDKAAFKAKMMRLKNLIRTYDPLKYQAQDLVSNKEDWIGSVKTVYDNILDYAEEVSSKPVITQGQDVTIQIEIDKAGDEFQKFLAAFNEKCCVVVAPQIQAQNHNNSTNSSQDSVNSMIIAERLRTAEVDNNINSEKVATAVKALKLEITKCEDWTVAEDHQIEIAMTKVESWTAQMKYLKERIWEMKRSVEIFDLDRAQLARCETAVNTVVDEATLTIENIQHEDDNRFLFSLSKSKKADLKYPDFGGKPDEDFSKFCTEFKAALLGNRVSAGGQVAKLREHLNGGPKSLIPATMKTVEEALKVLTPIYGGADKTMDSRKDKIKALGPFPKSTLKTSANIGKQLQWYLALQIYLEDLQALADESDELNREIYNLSTHRTLLELFPMEMHEDLSNVEGNVKTKIEFVHTYITDRKSKLQNQLKTLPVEPGGKSKTNLSIL